MSLPYPRRKLSEALTVLSRRSVDLGDLVLTAWEDRSGLHADPGCSPETQPAEVTLREWVDAQESHTRGFSCTCGGVIGYTPGSVLDALALSLQALEAERTKYVAKSWAEVDAWFAIAAHPLQEHRNIAYSTANVIADLPEEIAAAALAVAERSTASLPIAELHHAVAAQGILVPIRPSLGTFFERWAMDHITAVTYQQLTPSSPSSPPFARKPQATPLFDTALRDALAVRSHLVLALALDELFTTPNSTPPIRLARMLLRASGVDHARVLSCVRLPAGLADGLHALLGPAGLSVECGDEALDEVTLELAVRLWTPSERGPLSRLDGAVGAARLMK